MTEEYSLTLETATRKLFNEAIASDSLVCGLRQVVHALEKGETTVCFLAENCDEKSYSSLIEALCKTHKVKLVQFPDNKKMGELAGKCKIDKEGKPRKVITCSSVAIKNTVPESDALKFCQAQV